MPWPLLDAQGRLCDGRALIGWRLVQRTPDGADYRHIEQKPPAELRELLARLRRLT